MTCSNRGAVFCVPGQRLRDQATETAAAAAAERRAAGRCIPQLPGQLTLPEV